MGVTHSKTVGVHMIKENPPEQVDIHVLAVADVVGARIAARDLARGIAMRRAHITEFARATGDAAQRLLALGGGHIRLQIVRSGERQGVSMTIEPTVSSTPASRGRSGGVLEAPPGSGPRGMVDITAWEDGDMAELWERVDRLV